eukprot:CAMPEP_0196805476 /NCGR_PEP_ID=MMETSP1362-20130617/5250_1 /TAXON_ID=163516 /ORGANISM="Leptocylindrus danicus, Strain CCMP1856" /LENGTH=34 /DNA_ID= /DNA_START= /DNA_END= /DNA_ORIENTATION=
MEQSSICSNEAMCMSMYINGEYDNERAVVNGGAH